MQGMGQTKVATRTFTRERENYRHQRRLYSQLGT
jgi:hypothetical protein